MGKGFRFQRFYLIKVQIPENISNKKKTETVFLMKMKYYKAFAAFFF